jgi:hypothetical protein
MPVASREELKRKAHKALGKSDSVAYRLDMPGDLIILRDYIVELEAELDRLTVATTMQVCQGCSEQHLQRAGYMADGRCAKWWRKKCAAMERFVLACKRMLDYEDEASRNGAVMLAIPSPEMYRKMSREIRSALADPAIADLLKEGGEHA